VLLRSLSLVALMASALGAQDSVYFPTSNSAGGRYNSIPFGSFTKYPFARNLKYQTLIPWAYAARLTRPYVEDIGFFSCQSGVQHFDSIRIRMSQTKSVVLATDFNQNLGATPVTVLDSKDYYWHLEKNKWARVGLQTPFRLTQGENVVVDIEVAGAVTLEPDFGPSANPGGFAQDDLVPRLFALDWKGAPPANGQLRISGLKIELAARAADLSLFGIGCKGAGATRPALHLSGTAKPSGTVFVGLAKGLPANPTLLVIGFDNRSPFPVQLGFGECRLFHAMNAALAAATDASGSLSLPLALPASPVLQNQRIYTQYFQVEVTKNGLGLRSSNYGRILVR